MADSINKKLTIDTKEAEKGLDKVNTKLKQTDQELKQGETQGKRTFGSWLKLFAGITAAAYVFKKAFDFASQFKNASRDAGETQNKFNEVFSSIQSTANETAKVFAKSFGLASSSAQKLLSDTGNILVGFGMTEKAALDMSVSINSVAQDLVSFTNYSGGVEGASAALTKALLGETESAKSLGIVIRQGTQEFNEQVKSIMANTGATEQQAKTQVIYQQILQQTAKAQGDYARTSDQLANKERALSELYKSISEQIGTSLIPAFDMYVDAQMGLLKMLQKDPYEKQIEDFNTLALRLDILSSKQNRSNYEQQEYIKAINTAKKNYPEYLGFLDSEKTSHEDIVKALKDQRDLVKQRAFEQQLQAKQSDLLKDEYKIRENLLETEEKYAKELSRINENATYQEGNNIIYQNAANIEQRRQEIARELNKNLAEQTAIEEKHKGILDQINTTHGQAIANTESEIKAKAELDEYTNKVNNTKKEEIDLNFRNIELQKTTLKTIEGITNAYEELEVAAVDTSTTEAEQWDAKLTKVQDFYAKYGQAINGAFQTATMYGQMELAQIDQKYSKEKELIESKFAAGIYNQEQYDQALKKMELKKEKEQKKIHERQKKIDIAMAVTNTAVAITNALRTQPFLPLGPIMAGLAAAQGAIQIATIKAQEFGDGGILQGASHAQGGIYAGNNQFVEGGEGVIPRSTVNNPASQPLLNMALQADGRAGFFPENANGRLGGGTGKALSSGSSQPIINILNKIDENGISTMVTRGQNRMQRSGQDLNSVG